MAPLKNFYSEINGQENASKLNMSLVALAAVGTLAFTLTSTSTSLWAPSTTRTPNTVTSQVVVPVVGAHQRNFVMPTASVDATKPAMASEDFIAQEPATAPVRPMDYLSGAVVAALGLCVAAWARTRWTQRPECMEALAPMAMTATAGATETTYYFLVANAKFMLFDEEHAMELLREKRRFLKEKNLPQDFWMVPNPEFLDSMPDIDKRVLKPCAALVSTDERWILFMKLRYDKVLMGSFKGSSDVTKALTTKGGDPIAAVPKWNVPDSWNKTVPYPHYADDWFHPFLVGAKST